MFKEVLGEIYSWRFKGNYIQGGSRRNMFKEVLGEIYSRRFKGNYIQGGSR